MEKNSVLSDSLSVYKRIADEKAEKGDLLGALGMYFTVLRSDSGNFEAIADIADCYSDMGLLSLSNRYWFYYLTVAPKNKLSIAYEELAINFFYMDNLWASGYYFHLKMEMDGFIAEEGLDEEIIKFFSSAEMKKDAYFLAYPFDKADYSFHANSAKRAIGGGDYRLAIKHFDKIPKECRTEEISGDYSTALFLAKKDDDVIDVCKDSLERHGENVTAYCSLASLYHARGDEDKADYYYNRALEVRKGERVESYKLAACAIERGDDAVVEENVEKILTERPYDDVMNFFLGIAKVNLGDVSGGGKYIFKALRIDPEDPFYAYYAELFRKAEKDGSYLDEYLPFKYEKRLPERVERIKRKEINAFLNGKKSEIFPEDDEVIDANRLFLYSDDIKTAKNAAFLLSASGKQRAKQILIKALLSEEIEDEIKSSIVYLLVVGGEKKPINAVIGSYFATIKPKKLIFERKEDGAAYLSAYALTIAKSMAWGIDDASKLTFNMNYLYEYCGKLIEFNGFGVEHIACICYLMCEFPRFGSVQNVCDAFNIKKEDVQKVSEFLDFIKKSKKNLITERNADEVKNKKKKAVKKNDKNT